MAAPGAWDRWIALELGRLNAGLVVERKTLDRLLAEPRPACRTREGDDHPFDPEALRRIAAHLTREEREGLRLPITVFVTGDLEDAAYVAEELAAKAIRATQGFGPAFPFRGGRMYLPHSLALDVVRHSGGTVQLAFG